MKYSIITPVYNYPGITRAIESVRNQRGDDYEHIVVDDCSDIGFYHDLMAEKDIVLLRNEERENKAITRNNGMKAAKGEWICWLDADDFYLPYYLDVCDQMIEKYPDKSVFNFGGIVTHSNWNIGLRFSNAYNKGDIFKSGTIMSGGFIFKRECLDKVGYLPNHRNPYEFGRIMRERNPELDELYGEQYDLGNPWGDDWAMFYLLTRDYEPQFVQVAPYVVMIRTPERKL